ncbi:DUF1127 domain-containing protein [Roseomonas sp. E05]|uniref:DUF1127 domain-containing protein n=1 Tax=Roseomonas sp. E05 TaxID=3046310 RepID=UPI0024BB042C|nr:DUF1127 domain-containing protein [Roseomonas sp. E05]MDJ0387877.1 DUF1127 domain-containing protein [Roseomonas sp. E05]
MLAPPGSTFRSPAARLTSGHGSRLEGWAASLRHALRVMETRRELARLDERLLCDIGMTRAEALTEAQRAPWDMRHRRG